MKKIYLTAAAALMTVVATAQNLDPTVEVTRTYEGKLTDVHKPSFEMAVPDTVQSFKLDFDYSVFDSPYKGSYEFNPYIMSMKPAETTEKVRNLYLRAGAGFTLHPTLDLVWSPDLGKDALSLDVYAANRSYVGKYKALGRADDWKGYDVANKVGADMRCRWRKATMTFETYYSGIAEKDYMKKRAYDSVNARFTLSSNRAWPEHFLYDLDLSYRFAEDKTDYASDRYVMEHNLRMDATFGPAFNKSHKILFDVDFELDTYSHALNAVVADMGFVPHYVYNSGRLHLDIGVRLSLIMPSVTSAPLYQTKGFFVYPDLIASYTLIKDAMKLYAMMGGGNRLNTYASLIERNHHLDMAYGRGIYGILDSTVETGSAAVGLEGRLFKVLRYNFRGGYANYANAPLDTVVEGPEAGTYLPALGYTQYQKCFASLDWELKLQSVRFDGALLYTYAWGEDPGFLKPADLIGNASFEYNWKRRVMAGVDCEFATGRRGDSPVAVPGYADLGIYGEYAFNRMLSFWLRGGNLLNMTIQRNVLFAEKGMNFTAGICLNF